MIFRHTIQWDIRWTSATDRGYGMIVGINADLVASFNTRYHWSLWNGAKFRFPIYWNTEHYMEDYVAYYNGIKAEWHQYEF